MKKNPRKATHGGARPGSGRKTGSGHGRTVVTFSVSMPAADRDRLDMKRGDLSRGAFLAKLF